MVCWLCACAACSAMLRAWRCSRKMPIVASQSASSMTAAAAGCLVCWLFGLLRASATWQSRCVPLLAGPLAVIQ